MKFFVAGHLFLSIPVGMKYQNSSGQEILKKINKRKDSYLSQPFELLRNLKSQCLLPSSEHLRTNKIFSAH